MNKAKVYCVASAVAVCVASNPSVDVLSTVIRFPIFQFGCFNVSSTVTFPNSSLVLSLKLPPLAVIIKRFTSALRFPCKDWKMAECSESIG